MKPEPDAATVRVLPLAIVLSADKATSAAPPVPPPFVMVKRQVVPDGPVAAIPPVYVPPLKTAQPVGPTPVTSIDPWVIVTLLLVVQESLLAYMTDQLPSGNLVGVQRVGNELTMTA
jgi:hypothetical protein